MKYNKSTAKIVAWTETNELEEAKGFNVDMTIDGNVSVILNALASVVSDILLDRMEEDKIDEALDKFVSHVKHFLKEDK